MQGIAVESARVAHAAFFVDREQCLERAVRQLIIVEHGQHQGDAGAVIGTERRSFGVQPAVTPERHDRVAREVVRRPGVALADHVQMRLQDDAGDGRATGAGRLAHDQVAGRVDPRRQAARFGPGAQMLAQARLALGRTRNRAQRREMRPDDGRLQAVKYRKKSHRAHTEENTRKRPCPARPATPGE